MNIDDEIKRIRDFLAAGKTRNEPDEALPQAPTIELIVNGELFVDHVPGTGLKVGVDYDTMLEGQEFVLYLFSNTPSDGDYNETVPVIEVKPYVVTVPKEKIEKLHKNELGLCLYFIDGKETSEWTTFTVR
ncbi:MULTISPECIES: hypothetical protein [Pseudomonas]|uniref:hypothetical protein n=1 Tax=Pseudomonas TaxID=286 RepID=UPI000CDB66E0|nr:MULTISPECIES: hypothetical protein [Pseudomonas]QUW66034.1 hypothetical protein KFQ04_00075 [Pseudomonas synxantha]MBY8969055.1 hypothetical protein [Pseudomonas sp. P867]MCK3830435.1 hypothetical protein [Pseudomonas fluorescens]MCK3851076.1 hypothetical protein [Pseudomonas sp. W2Jun17]UEH09414.1 hypothetical protein LJX92_04775 [Pseudomonas sp. HN8-3]